MLNKFYKNWHILILVAFSIVPIIWFFGKGNVIINGLDTNFPLDPIVWFQRRFFVWDSVLNAGRDFSSSTSGLFFHLIQVIPFSLGLNLQLVEILSLIFWFGLIVFSSYQLAKESVTKNRLIQLTFVVVYSFNIYLFNTWENVKVSNLALVVGLPLFLTIFEKYRKRKINISKLFFFSVLIVLVSSGSGINPAYFLAILFALLIYVVLLLVFEKDSRRLIVKGVLVVFSTMILINLFWILPLTVFLTGLGNGSISDLGFTNWIYSLSINTSLDNVVRFMGAWDWYVKGPDGSPLYIPYALNYFSNPLFVSMSFLVPILVVISLYFRESKNKIYYILFATFSIVGIFLGAGVHKPTGYLYEFLLKSVPFFSFFRSPWYIFTPYYMLGASGLVSLFFNFLSNNIRTKKLFTPLIFLFLILQVIYSYPLLTGKIFRPGRPDSFYVTIPQYVYDFKNWIRNNPQDGRILVYPDDVLESFKWGYKGTESIIGLVASQDFYTPSFNSVNNISKFMLPEYYKFLKSGNFESVMSLSRILGINSILVKKDAISNAPEPDVSKIMNYTTPNRFGEWTLYKIREELLTKKIFAPQIIYNSYLTPDAVAIISPILEPNSIVVQNNDSEVSKVPLSINTKNILVEAKNPIDIFDKVNEVANYIVEVPVDGFYTLAFQKDSLKEIQIEIEGKRYIPNESTEGFFLLENQYFIAGNHEIRVNFPDSENLLKGLDFSTYAKATNLRNEDLPRDTIKTLVLYSDKEKEKKFDIKIENISNSSKYVFEVSYKHFYGWNPGVDIVQKNDTDVFRLYPLNLSHIPRDWEQKRILVEPAQIKSELLLSFTLPDTWPDSKSKTFVENFSLKRINDNKLFLISETEKNIQNPPKVSFKKVNPTLYEIVVDPSEEGFVLSFLENYDKNWQITFNDGANRSLHFMTNSYANGWYVSQSPKKQTIKISYKPQKYFNIGVTVALMVCLFSFTLFIKNRKK